MWIYTARIYSPSRQFVTTSQRALTDEDAADPECRAYAEQLAKETLCNLEGVKPDTPIESDGWRYSEL